MNNKNKQQISGARLILLLAIHAIYIAGKQHTNSNCNNKHNECDLLFYVDRFVDKWILDNISWFGGKKLTSLDAKNLMLEIIEKDNIFTSEGDAVSDFQIKSFDILEYDVRTKRDNKPSLLSSFEAIPDDANPDSFDVIHKKIFTINYNESEAKFNRYIDVFYNEENVNNVVVESFPVCSVEGDSENERKANNRFNEAMSWLIQIYEYLGLSNHVFVEGFFANDELVVQARHFYISCLDEYNNKQLEQQNKMNKFLEKKLSSFPKTDNFSKLLK